MTDPLVSTTTVEDESDIREFCDRLSTSLHNRWVDERERSGYELGEYDPLELIVEWRFEEREHAALTDGGTDTALPLDEVPTPTLDSWEARLGNWATWARIEDGTGYKVHAEYVDLEVPPDVVTYGFELRLDYLPERGTSETVVRETVHNPFLALRMADELAGNAEKYVDDWEEGLCPRPEEVGRLDE
jgi:hypothetical protein